MSEVEKMIKEVNEITCKCNKKIEDRKLVKVFVNGDSNLYMTEEKRVQNYLSNGGNLFLANVIFGEVKDFTSKSGLVLMCGFEYDNMKEQHVIAS